MASIAAGGCTEECADVRPDEWHQPGGEAADEDQAFADFVALRAEIRRRGYDRKDSVRILAQLAAHCAITIGGLGLFLAADSLWVQFAALLVLTSGLLGISTNTHTSSHYATVRSARLNEMLTYFGYPVVLGMSAAYWWHKHVAIHHRNPNLIGLDDDVDLMPFFALTDRERQSARGWLRAYYAVQWLLIPFALALNALNVQWFAWRFLYQKLRDPSERHAGLWADVGCLVLHHVLWIGIPMAFFHPGDVILFHLLKNAALGYGLFSIFAPAHFPEEAACGDPRERNSDFLLKQTTTTVNFRTGWYGRFLCSGVEYQIEHHLLCGISHTYYPEISPLLRQFCDSHAYPYRTLGWGHALWKSLLVFYRPKRVEAALQDVARRLEPSAGARAPAATAVRESLVPHQADVGGLGAAAVACAPRESCIVHVSHACPGDLNSVH